MCLVFNLLPLLYDFRYTTELVLKKRILNQVYYGYWVQLKREIRNQKLVTISLKVTLFSVNSSEEMAQ